MTNLGLVRLNLLHCPLYLLYLTHQYFHTFLQLIQLLVGGRREEGGGGRRGGRRGEERREEGGGREVEEREEEGNHSKGAGK